VPRIGLMRAPKKQGERMAFAFLRDFVQRGQYRTIALHRQAPRNPILSTISLIPRLFFRFSPDQPLFEGSGTAVAMVRS
jgi:hypothetical protein